jgi:hypothetical protein
MSTPRASAGNRRCGMINGPLEATTARERTP